MVVCPFCHKGFRDSDPLCPICRRPFSFKDWCVIEAYSIDGLVPKLTVKWAGNTWSPNAAQFIVGRTPSSYGLTLSDPTISANHAIFILEDNVWKIKRFSEKNRLKINDSELGNEAKEIFSGDKIKIGISAPLEVIVEYSRKSSINLISGKLASKTFDNLDQAEPLRIGSDASSCDVIINNIDKCNSIIYYQQALKSWWLVDCASTCGTKLNGLPIRNEELFEGDKISIAGVDFIFESNILLPLSSTSAGLAVNLENLSASTKDGHFLLKDIDLKIRPREFVGIIGPSGCGKSSLIQRLAGLGSFCKGQVKVNGLTYKEKENNIKALTAYVPQDVALHYDLTLEEEIESFCSLHIKKSEIAEDKIDTALRLVQLTNERNKRIGDLSGGQKRRATIMLELLRAPQLLLLDEPTAGLDPATETDIMKYLRRISTQGKTVICSTHILGNLHLFDKILVLSSSEMVFWGMPSELLNYFHINSILELYRLLGSGSKKEQREISQQYATKYKNNALYKKYTSQEQLYADLPEAESSSSIFQQIFGYLYRQFLEFISFRNLNPKGFLKEFFTSSALIQLVIQPVLIALVLKFACASYFYTGNDYKKIFFFSAIAVFWLGLNSAIRELVKERTPWRCLERLEHISIVSYLSSKVIWSILISLIQTSVFLAVLYGFEPIQTEEVSLYWTLNNEFKYADSAVFGFSPIIACVLFSVCIMGSWIALAISAFFKKETPAVGLLPIILIPVLFFSQPIMLDDNYDNYPSLPVEHTHEQRDDENYCKECIKRKRDAHELKTSNGQYSIIAFDIRRFMPCHEPQIFMDLWHNKVNKEKDLIKEGKSLDNLSDHFKTLPQVQNRMLRNTVGYMLLSLLFMAFFQYRNEKKWEGR